MKSHVTLNTAMLPSKVHIRNGMLLVIFVG